MTSDIARRKRGAVRAAHAQSRRVMLMKKPGLIEWMLFGRGPGPGQPDYEWRKKAAKAGGAESPKLAIKCDMCSGKSGGPACVRACPTGAAIRVTPDAFLSVARIERAG